MACMKQRFEEFRKASFYSRVDAFHPLELYIGLDDSGRKSIELRDKFKPQRIKGTKVIEVSQYSKNEYNTVRFSLLESELSGLFYLFCEDLMEESRNINLKEEGYMCITNRFIQWKNMFKVPKREYLTELEIMGLIGEILFLKGPLSDKIGLKKALLSWSGQELTHKDFSCDANWYEVKAISTGKTTIQISSLEQLESESVGELHVYMLEKMSTTYNGINLNKLILETRAAFEEERDKDTFMSKVAIYGYEYSDYYDDYIFEQSDYKRYIVREKFPRLMKNNVPLGIVKAKYEISLMDIEKYKIE